MNLLQTLDTIDRHGATLNLIAGRLRLTGSAAARAIVRDDIAHHRDLLMVHLRGIDTGHLLAFCDTCGAATLTAAKAPHGKDRTTWPTCRETPGCPGHHHPRPVDLQRWRDAPAPPAMTQPPRRQSKQRRLGALPSWTEADQPSLLDGPSS